jgi:ubiquinone/menaquinone biosynthesis C-methylase UbiE
LNLRKLKIFLILIPVIIALGGISTYIHFENKTVDVKDIFSVNVVLIIMNLLVFAGLFIRFFKWHFFLRFYDIKLKIRKSFAIFFASLFVNLFSPFLIGEFITKLFFLRKEGFDSFKKNLLVVVSERLFDFISISLLGVVFLSFNPDIQIVNTSEKIVTLTAAFASILILLSFFAVRVRHAFKLISFLLIGLSGWFVIYIIYFIVPAEVRHAMRFGDFGYIFSNYLIFYPSTPMGIFLSGNYMYATLENIIHNPYLLLQVVINIRIASIAPSFIFGLAGLISLLKRKKAGRYHFDEISDEYSEMIPEHIRVRLIERKCNYMLDEIKNESDKPDKLTGLDLGGGKGWYTSRMTDITNANVILVDRSFNQAKDAVTRDPRFKAVVADMTNLPFKDDKIDFAFSINVVHHLDDRKAQARAMESISRVLKTGSPFMLHEMNTHNIVFKIYMNYLFPLYKTIDEGVEWWIDPRIDKFGNLISDKIIYFTFVPDFINYRLMKMLMPVEKRLENSRFSKYSAHYFRVFRNRKQKS